MSSGVFAALPLDLTHSGSLGFGSTAKFAKLATFSEAPLAAKTDFHREDAKRAKASALERASLFLAEREETEPSPGFRAGTWFQRVKAMRSR